MMKLPPIMIALALLLTLATSPPVTSIGEGVGVMPMIIKIENALKGETYQRNIRIVNNGNETLQCTLSSSDMIGNWVEFYKENDTDFKNPINSTTIPKNSKTKINLLFKIPKNAANGLYEGFIYVEIGGNAPLNNSAGLKMRWPVRVFINVTGEEQLSGNVTNIKIWNTETGLPLIVEIDFINIGNVMAHPLIKVDISREGWPIDKITYQDIWIQPNTGETITIKWNTTNREPGKYNATVCVLLGGKTLKEEKIEFEIYPRGTLTRKGELINLTFAGKPSIGKTLRILGQFKNVGLVEINAKMVLEIYVNGELVDTLESEEVLIPIRKTFTFIEYLKIKDFGEYLIRGYVTYETNMTRPLNISFQVNSPVQNMLPIVISIIAGGIFIVGVYIVRNGKNSKLNNKSNNSLSLREKNKRTKQ